ncbi:hypothetical protein EDC01DRAFT_676952 [Geopyxis carbonaria]|nr:hypothetical protein EDC01DRAFT_676952 [Geopyxis carbonaria]
MADYEQRPLAIPSHLIATSHSLHHGAWNITVSCVLVCICVCGHERVEGFRCRLSPPAAPVESALRRAWRASSCRDPVQDPGCLLPQISDQHLPSIHAPTLQRIHAGLSGRAWPQPIRGIPSRRLTSNSTFFRQNIYINCRVLYRARTKRSEH